MDGLILQRSLLAGVYLRRARRPSRAGAILALVGALACSLGEAQESTLPLPEGARRLAKESPVWVDAEAEAVLIDGGVALREGVLEMFACPKGTKEHESVISIDAPAFLIHTALLAVGAEPGHPVRFNPKYEPPTGDEIEITLTWVENGEEKSARAQEWVREVDSGKAMALPFVFAGSGFWTDPNTGKQHYLADGGDLICVSNFGGAMLDVPAESTQANDGLWFEPYTERIPPAGTPVRLTLKPKAVTPETEFSAAIKTLRSASVGEGSTAATQAAWQQLASAPAEALPELLAAMQDASPLAENWLRTAIDALVDRVGTETLDADRLLAFTDDRSNAPRARRTAYELACRSDSKRATAWLAGAIDDPSLEIRYDAIALLLEAAGSAPEDQKATKYRQALQAARTLDQIEAAEEGLKKVGEEVSLVDQLGLVTPWLAAGPFDNRLGKGFGKEYGPEQEVDATSTYEGHDQEEPHGPFGWKPYTTNDRLGEVELNDAIGIHKEAAGYAWTTLVAEEPRSIEVRYSSKAATKVWLNGQLLAANETYHSGSPFDQHVVPAKLFAGKNELLVKACQNDQTEPWAETWPFTLRLTGPAGAPLEGVDSRLPITDMVTNQATEQEASE